MGGPCCSTRSSSELGLFQTVAAIFVAARSSYSCSDGSFINARLAEAKCAVLQLCPSAPCADRSGHSFCPCQRIWGGGCGRRNRGHPTENSLPSRCLRRVPSHRRETKLQIQLDRRHPRGAGVQIRALMPQLAQPPANRGQQSFAESAPLKLRQDRHPMPAAQKPGTRAGTRQSSSATIRSHLAVAAVPRQP